MAHQVRFDRFRWDPETRRLWAGAQEVRLTPKAGAVLAVLLARGGEPVTKEDLFASVWPDTAVSDDALTTCIVELRRALEDDAKQARFIETRHRRGYRFAAASRFPRGPRVCLPLSRLPPPDRGAHGSAQPTEAMVRHCHLGRTPGHGGRPDIGSVEALTRTLLDARSVAYLRVGSGLHMEEVVERLGIAAALSPKTLRPDTDIVAELVAKGEAELGIVVITQIVTTPGVALAGPLPPELQAVITFTAGVSATSSVPQAARDLIAFLTEGRARAVIHAQGMEPAR